MIGTTQQRRVNLSKRTTIRDLEFAAGILRDITGGATEAFHGGEYGVDLSDVVGILTNERAPSGATYTTGDCLRIVASLIDDGKAHLILHCGAGPLDPITVKFED